MVVNLVFFNDFLEYNILLEKVDKKCLIGFFIIINLK